MRDVGAVWGGDLESGEGGAVESRGVVVFG